MKITFGVDPTMIKNANLEDIKRALETSDGCGRELKRLCIERLVELSRAEGASHNAQCPPNAPHLA